MNNCVRRILISIVDGKLDIFNKWYKYFELNKRFDYCELMVVCLLNYKDISSDPEICKFLLQILRSAEFVNYSTDLKKNLNHIYLTKIVAKMLTPYNPSE
jgi:hypothetical protein